VKRKTVEPVVCVIDAPWEFKTWTSKGRAKCPKYDTMPLADIAALGPAINDMIGSCAVIHVWVTDGLLPDALAMCATWGWEYVTWRAWKKRKLGLGYWKRSDAEILLTFKVGKPRAPKRGTQARTLFEGSPEQNRHSSKPTTLHEEIERQYPNSRKIELFARRQRLGWECVGSDLGTLITAKGVIALTSETPQDVIVGHMAKRNEGLGEHARGETARSGA
jgi:N6-adenosine-specific RNA methylase IME4